MLLLPAFSFRLIFLRRPLRPMSNGNWRHRLLRYPQPAALCWPCWVWPCWPSVSITCGGTAPRPRACWPSSPLLAAHCYPCKGHRGWWNWPMQRPRSFLMSHPSLWVLVITPFKTGSQARSRSRHCRMEPAWSTRARPSRQSARWARFSPLMRYAMHM